MKVQYIPVGKKQVEDLSWTPHDIATSLLEDWLPTMPLNVGTTFFGWPNHIIQELNAPNQGYMAIQRSLSTTDRQWKGVISWMLGIAGARRVLRQEGYRWIAPASAFYPRSNGQLNPQWPNQFPRTEMIVDRLEGSKSRFRPDYLALRQVGGGYELAAVEAKGTAMSIAKSTRDKCPDDWREQVRNITLTLKGDPVYIARHIVVATRVNPTNSPKPSSRMLALRAWNSANEGREPDPFVVVAIVIANLFGFLHNIGLPETANALAKKLTDWSSGKSELLKIDELDGGAIFPPPRLPVDLVLKTNTQEKIVIDFRGVFRRLINRLLRSEDTFEALKWIDELDSFFPIDSRPQRNIQSKDEAISVLPYGVIINTYSSVE
jgi:hypothetical protein